MRELDVTEIEAVSGGLVPLAVGAVAIAAAGIFAAGVYLGYMDASKEDEKQKKQK